MIKRHFSISLKPLSKAGMPQRTQTFTLFIYFLKILLSKQNLAYNITRTRHFGIVIPVWYFMTSGNT